MICVTLGIYGHPLMFIISVAVFFRVGVAFYFSVSECEDKPSHFLLFSEVHEITLHPLTTSLTLQVNSVIIMMFFTSRKSA